MNNKYENYLNDREVNKIVPPTENISNENKYDNQKKNMFQQNIIKKNF